MKHFDIFTDITAEYNEEIALTAIIINAISANTKAKKKHLTGEKAFSDTVEKKARVILWETNDVIFEKAFRLSWLIDEYTSRQSLKGLGGCTLKTFRELMGDNSNASN